MNVTVATKPATPVVAVEAMEAAAPSSANPAPRLLAVAAVGAAISLGIGIYGHVHDPSGKLVFTLGFSSTIAMKVWFATVAVAFAVVQVALALWLYGRLPWSAPDWVGNAHRISGRLAFLISLPVAYHCLWSLGFQDTNGRVLAHSLLGCAFYGAFASKILIVRSKSLPGIALPIAGGLVFALLVALWFTSGFWFIDHQGFPDV